MGLSSYIGIFVISGGTLTFQILLTRIFSISQWYHFAFMAVSIALLGFGASGSFLFLFPKLINVDEKKSLGILSLLFSYTTLISYWTINNLPLDSFRIGIDRIQIFYLFLTFSQNSIPLNIYCHLPHNGCL